MSIAASSCFKSSTDSGFLQPVSVPIIRSTPREALHKELDECDGLRLVDDIHQEGADNGHDHEGTSGHAVFLGDSGHVHDGAGRCAEAVAAKAGAHDSGVIVGAQDPEHHEVGDDGHKHSLAEHHQQHAAHEVQQIPEAQGHEGEAQIEVQHHGAQLVGQREAELVEIGLLVHIAEDDGNKHCSHVAGE